MSLSDQYRRVEYLERRVIALSNLLAKATERSYRNGIRQSLNEHVPYPGQPGSGVEKIFRRYRYARFQQSFPDNFGAMPGGWDTLRQSIWNLYSSGQLLSSWANDQTYYLSDTRDSLFTQGLQPIQNTNRAWIQSGDGYAVSDWSHHEADAGQGAYIIARRYPSLFFKTWDVAAGIQSAIWVAMYKMAEGESLLGNGIGSTTLQLKFQNQPLTDLSAVNGDYAGEWDDRTEPPLNETPSPPVTAINMRSFAVEQIAIRYGTGNSSVPNTSSLSPLSRILSGLATLHATVAVPRPWPAMSEVSLSAHASLSVPVGHDCVFVALTPIDPIYQGSNPLPVYPGTLEDRGEDDRYWVRHCRRFGTRISSVSATEVS